jgi:hypothetical protein
MSPICPALRGILVFRDSSRTPSDPGRRAGATDLQNVRIDSELHEVAGSTRGRGQLPQVERHPFGQPLEDHPDGESKAPPSRFRTDRSCTRPTPVGR